MSASSPLPEADTHRSGETDGGVRPSAPREEQRSRGQLEILAVALVVAGLVAYLGIDGGGYDLVVRNQVGLIVWWLLLCLVVVRRPAVPRSGAIWAVIGLFAAFTAWTAVMSTSSLSPERSLQELSRVVCYLGVLILGVAVHRDRDRGTRLTVSAVAVALVLVSSVALVGRLVPGSFPAANPGADGVSLSTGRLSWPVNYWNALAVCAVLAIPLLLAITTSARRWQAQALGAAGLPIVTLCAYLTVSRGGALCAAVGVILFIALAPNRVPKLIALAAPAGAGVVLILLAAQRKAIQKGLTGSAARHQGLTLMLALAVACVVVMIVQVALRRFIGPSPSGERLVVPRRAVLPACAVAVVVAVAAGLALGVPGRIDHAWQAFKRPAPSVLAGATPGRFGAASGEGRYDLWRVAVRSTRGHLLTGSGPGTFQLLWLPRAPYFLYVRNAHSLYVETLAEVGLIGLILLVAFLAGLIGVGVRLVRRGDRRLQTHTAAVVAAVGAFAVAVAFDWFWQVPVLPVAVLLLGASLLLPETSTSPARPGSRWRRAPVTLAAAVVSAACLVAMLVPLAVTTEVRRSQAAAADPSAALADAQSALRLEPGSATAAVQAALVLELERRFPAAVQQARRAISDEPDDWQSWLILSRLEAESHHPQAAIVAYRRARALNPRSPVFA